MPKNSGVFVVNGIPLTEDAIKSRWRAVGGEQEDEETLIKFLCVWPLVSLNWKKWRLLETGGTYSEYQCVECLARVVVDMEDSDEDVLNVHKCKRVARST